MENANLSAIPERLGSWNWSGADAIGIKIHDRMMTVANVSESVAIFQVLRLLFYCVFYLNGRSQGKLELSGTAASDNMLLEFDGVHFTKNGSFYAFAQEEGCVT